MMPTVLVLSYSDLARDPRVNRQIRFLSEKYRVVCAGTGEPNVAGVEFVSAPSYDASLFAKGVSAGLLLAGQFETYYWRQPWVCKLLASLGSLRPDLIVANDANTLPLAHRLAREAPVLFDAHEYAPLEFEDRWMFRVFFQNYVTYLCRAYIPRCAAMTTVCQGIATRYESEFSRNCSVIWNAPDHADLAPCSSDDRGDCIRLVHHGVAHPSRKIECTLDLMRHVDGRFSLDLFLMPSVPGYLEKLRKLADKLPRIQFHEPVPMRQIAARTNEYDVGVFLLPPTNFNYRQALPNKFFEFVQARLAVAIGPSPEMVRLVERHDLGVVADDFQPASLARQLATLSRTDVERYKLNAHKVARELSADVTRVQLLEIAARLLK